jgi:hypothetical protein
VNQTRVVNHKLHIILSILTGVWLPIYGLIFVWYKRKGSTLENRREKREKRRELLLIARQTYNDNELKKNKSPSNLGYKKPSVFHHISPLPFPKLYFLNCGHEIRARGRLTGNIGKKVWCLVCKDERMISSQPTSFNRM